MLPRFRIGNSVYLCYFAVVCGSLRVPYIKDVVSGNANFIVTLPEKNRSKRDLKPCHGDDVKCKGLSYRSEIAIDRSAKGNPYMTYRYADTRSIPRFKALRILPVSQLFGVLYCESPCTSSILGFCAAGAVSTAYTSSISV